MHIEQRSGCQLFAQRAQYCGVSGHRCVPGNLIDLSQVINIPQASMWCFPGKYVVFLRDCVVFLGNYVVFPVTAVSQLTTCAVNYKRLGFLV